MRLLKNLSIEVNKIKSRLNAGAGRQLFDEYPSDFEPFTIKLIETVGTYTMTSHERILGLESAVRYLVHGGQAHRPKKRWPAACYGRAAAALAEQGLCPVLIGTAPESAVLADIAAACPQAVDLCGRTDFGAIAACTRGAALAIGNDTGPMHIIATAGCPSLALFSGASKPALTAPYGPQVTVLQRDSLGDLEVDEVMAALKAIQADVMTPQRRMP